MSLGFTQRAARTLDKGKRMWWVSLLGMGGIYVCGVYPKGCKDLR